MDRFAKLVGRQYHLFDYVGDPQAKRVIVMMASGAETAHETVEYLNATGEKVGLVKVRLFRPFAGERLVEALPSTTKTIAVFDRTKEPGAPGEPLYQDVVTALAEHAAFAGNRFATPPRVIGGRYGLSSKEFTPAMLKGVFDEMQSDRPKNHFAVGVADDVTGNSIDYDPSFTTEDQGAVRAIFYGLGADGTVGANKNSIKIIGEETEDFTQGYFVYDSKKAGSITVSHLRFGKRPIRSTYLVQEANFVACHQQQFIDKYEMLAQAVPEATFLLNAQEPPDNVWETLPCEVQQQILDKRMKFYVIDAYEWRARRAWARASTRSCRPASSRSPACYRATKQSRRSKEPFARPTVRRAKQSSPRTSRPWIKHSPTSSRWRFRAG